jgi:signal peptidase I
MDGLTARRAEAGCELVADVVRQFGSARLTVNGSSMIPAVWPGDVLHVNRSSIDGLHPGDIIVYRRGEHLITHRLTSVRGTLLVTRGDAVRYNDADVCESELVGKVITIVRAGRRHHPRQSIWQRAGSSILQRSPLCARITLLLGARLRACPTPWAD